MTTKIWTILIKILAVVLVFVLTATPIAYAGQPDEDDSDESLSANTGLVLISTSTKPVKVGGVTTNGAGGHFWAYLPPCISPPHATAWAVFTVGPGPFTLQFHGTGVWSSSGYCNAASCMYWGWGGMYSGDSIWVYSVTASSSTHVSAWCSTGGSS